MQGNYHDTHERFTPFYATLHVALDNSGVQIMSLYLVLRNENSLAVDVLRCGHAQPQRRGRRGHRKTDR